MRWTAPIVAAALLLAAPGARAQGVLQSGIGTNSIPLSDLAQQTANTVLGNSTSGTANVTALSVGGCSTAASALIWTTNTGFGCNTSINAAQLGGATFAAPGAIGGGTAAAGTFTTITGTSLVGSAGDGAIPIAGTNTNDNASAGNIGEVISSVIGSGSAVSLTNATGANITSIPLTAGDWDVWGEVSFQGAGTTTLNYYGCDVNATTATVGIGFTPWTGSAIYATVTPIQCNTFMKRVSLSGATTYFLTAQSGFGTSTSTAYGQIFARRRR